MPGINCRSAATGSSGTKADAPAIQQENWKFYDNPFFVAAVASAVVEATLGKQELVKDCKQEVEEEKKPERNHNGRRPRNFVSGLSPSRAATPRTARVQQQQSPEVKKKQQTVPVEDTSQKLRLELLKTWTTVERLEKAHTAAKSKLERLSSRYEDGRSLWESQVQDKITSSLQAMRHKLKEEKNANKSLELANQKLEAELLEIRKAIAQAKKDIVAERNSKRMVEDVCDELAKEVGDDKALAIELRRQASTARREAEETRKALQMGEVWKEEKVQGRLAEARFGIEHRNSELDGAIARVEGFLDNRKKLVEKAMDSSSTVVADNSSTGSSPRSSSQSFDKRIYKEQTRLLLNGSGFHMRNKAYGSGGVKNGVRTPAIPKIWPTSKSPNFD